MLMMKKKKYIRSTPISLDKINLFKSKFVENYYKNAKLYEILNSTNNIIRVKKKKKGSKLYWIKQHSG